MPKCATTPVAPSPASRARNALDALKSAFPAAPEEFKFALADSLRQRGQTVSGYPSRKLVPVKQTSLSSTPPATKPGS